jgi:hypothetical protein
LKRRASRLHRAEFERVGGGLGAVLNAEFGQYRADVGANRFGADVKCCSDFIVDASLGEQFQDLAFASRRAIGVGQCVAPVALRAQR